jgi:hypothetical protein
LAESNDTILPVEAQLAWEAYQAMGKSKAEYFSLLQYLDQKYRGGGTPSIAENLQLENLLKAHDEKVVAFNKAMHTVRDKKARELLLKKLSEDAIHGMH